MTDVFKQLRRFSWRGIELPLIARHVSHAHEQVNHPLVYQDGELVESTGAKNWTFSYTIPFRENIVKGPYRELFTRMLIDEFIPAYLDRTAGPLVDPVLGPFRCKPVSFDDTTDLNKRDGEDIAVAFTHAPEQDVTEEIAGELGSIEAIDERSAFLDAQMETAFVEAEQEPPEPLFNPLDVATGIGAQIEVFGDRIAAKADAVAFKAEKAEEQLATLQNPQNAPIIRSLRRLRRASGRLKSRVINPLQLPITVRVPNDMTMTALSALYNMSLADLQRLNPSLRAFVRGGTRVRVLPSGGPL